MKNLLIELFVVIKDNNYCYNKTVKMNKFRVESDK